MSGFDLGTGNQVGFDAVHFSVMRWQQNEFYFADSASQCTGVSNSFADSAPAFW